MSVGFKILGRTSSLWSYVTVAVDISAWSVESSCGGRDVSSSSHQIGGTTSICSSNTKLWKSFRAGFIGTPKSWEDKHCGEELPNEKVSKLLNFSQETRTVAVIDWNSGKCRRGLSIGLLGLWIRNCCVPCGLRYCRIQEDRSSIRSHWVSERILIECKAWN